MGKIFLCFWVWLGLLGQVRAQWVQTNGPVSGIAVSCMEFGGEVDIVSATCGIYYKEKTDTIWSFTNLPGCQTLMPFNNGFLAGYTDGVYKIVHDGSWNYQRILGASQNTNVIKLSGTRLFAGLDLMGLYKSDDLGVTWSQANNGLPVDTGWSPGGYYYLKYAFDLLNVDGNLFCGTQKGVYFSTDNGQSWSAKNQGLPLIKIRKLFRSGAYLFALSDNMIYRTTYSTIQWSPVFSGSQFKGITGIGDTLMLASASGVFISSDEGSSWQTWNEGLEDLSVISCQSHCDTFFAGASNSGLYYRKINGSQWQKMNHGLLCSSIGPLKANGEWLVACDYHKLFRTRDEGNSWEPLTIPESVRFLSAIEMDTDALIASITYPAWPPAYAGIYHSNDVGLNWTLASNLPYYDDPYRLYLYENQLYAWEDNRLFVSDDYGHSWSDITIPPQFCNNVNTVYRNGNQLFVGTCGELLLSVDGGNTYQEVTGGLPGSLDCSYLTADDFLMLLYANYHIYVSQDGGVSWEIRPSWDPNRYCRASLVNNGNMILAADGNLYLSSNTGHTFVLYPGIENVDITSMQIMNNQIFAGTDKNGVWKIPLHELPLETSEIYIKPTIDIFPNPASDLLILRFLNLPEIEGIISIHNSLGSSVYSSRIQGKEISLDISKLSPGVYIFTIESKENRLATKFVKSAP